MRPRPQYRGNAALQLDYGADPEYDLDPLANIVPMGPRVTILELTEATCRWPIGDPGATDFVYCGSQNKVSLPYCPYHARIAYQPLAERRRERRAMRAGG
jgi:GcrA cell cycle regulator